MTPSLDTPSGVGLGASHLPVQVEGSMSGEDNIEIVEMLISMKRDMEEREQKWER